VRKWKVELERFLASRTQRRAWHNYAKHTPEEKKALILAWADAKLPIILTGNEFDPDVDYSRMHIITGPRKLSLTEEELRLARIEYERIQEDKQ
jgi:hypothetical protein